MRFLGGFVVLSVTLGMAFTVMAVNPGTDVVVAACGTAAGMPPAYWLTDLIVYCPGPSAATITVYYLPRGGDNSGASSLDFTIQPGATLIRPNVVGTDFGEESLGALRIVSDQTVVVHSVTKNNPGGPAAPDRDALGQGFPGIPVSEAIAAGHSTVIPGLTQNADQRSNFGVVDVSGAGSEVVVRIVDPSGAQLGSRTYTLAAWEPFQASAMAVVAEGFEAGTLAMDVVSGAVVGYASKVNTGSGDASTLEMYWPCDSRTTSDGTYAFVTTTETGDISGGGTVTVSGGVVTELSGKVIGFAKDPPCSLVLPYCIQDATALSAFASGQDIEVNYSHQGDITGNVTWHLTLGLTDNLSVAGTLTGSGSGWGGSLYGCNGVLPTMTVTGGVR